MTDERGLVRYQASDGSEVKLTPGIVQRYIVTGGQRVDDREVFAFMAKCQARGLNPLAGDAYMTAFMNKATGRVEASVIVSKDYFVRTATQQPGFDGLRAGVVVVDRTGAIQYREGCIVGRSTEKLVGGWAEVPPTPAGDVLEAPAPEPEPVEAPEAEPAPVADDGPDEYAAMEGNYDEAAEAVDF